ncbi:hypothetical protein [Permianibacter aggregans]|uniref:Uncharacterized protein n=1 Tax=Permianibacter aggregans TaxID=1510150 RepID=A0A4R6UFL7_9GAMM|nr:hypothetical protein [Permianibacter aggregans]QGX38424.1 hypothetical protein E2H98_01580 [Permianibacter aggregans]TDQ45538.1 hypothetical protein EV696_1196 [Permianibacter aggregans]
MKFLLIFLFTTSLPAYASQNASLVDDPSTSLIIYEVQTESKSSEGSSGSSNSRSTIVERIIGEREEGLELEYSFPKGDVPEIEAWKLPARVLNKPGSHIELLNKAEINARLDAFLEKHPEIRKHCGGVVFTWAAFEIHCDTNHVVDVIAGYNLYLGALSEGQLYTEPGALAPAPLKVAPSETPNQIYEVTLVLDPVLLQSEYEKSMEQAAAITGMDAIELINSSLHLGAGEQPDFSGTRVVVLEASSDGRVEKIQRQTTIVIKGGGLFHEVRKQKESLKRRPINQDVSDEEQRYKDAHMEGR